jgi:hypothetical protein
MTKFVVALTSFASRDYVIPRGRELPVDHAAVQNFPMFFGPDDASDEELARLRSEWEELCQAERKARSESACLKRRARP